jgi:hypothetical protein
LHFRRNKLSTTIKKLFVSWNRIILLIGKIDIEYEIEDMQWFFLTNKEMLFEEINLDETIDRL